jgi:hypothetical protein
MALAPRAAEAQWVNWYQGGEGGEELVFNSLVRDPTPDTHRWVVTGSLDDELWVGLMDFGGKLIWSATYGSGEGRDVILLDSDDEAPHFVVAGKKVGGVLMEFEAASDKLEMTRECRGGPQVYSLVQADDRSIVAVGKSGNDPFAYKTITGDGGRLSCGVEWSFSLPSDSERYLYSVKLLSDGDLVAVGRVDQSDESGERRGGVVVKFGMDGSILFATMIEDHVVDPNEVHSGINLLDVLEIPEGPDGYCRGLIVVGNQFGGLAFHPSFSDLFLAKLDMAGNVQWATQWSNPLIPVPNYSWWWQPRNLFLLDGNTIGVVGTRVLHNNLPGVDDEWRGTLVQFEMKPDWMVMTPLDLVHDMVTADSVPRVLFQSATETDGGGLAIVGWQEPGGTGPAFDELGIAARANEEWDIPQCMIAGDLEQVFQPVLWQSAVVEPQETGMAEYFSSPIEEQIPRRPLCAPCVVFVDHEQTGSEDGESWATAFDTVQEGIDKAYELGSEPGQKYGYCEVWVAQGDYHVYQTVPQDSIVMRPGVHVFGGFSGEGWEASRDDRVWQENTTRLLGSHFLDEWQRVYHVVRGSNDSTLDGFHVAGGRALDNVVGFRLLGGGMLNWRASPKVRNCSFYDNQAIWGGAMANLLSAPRVENCGFVQVEGDPVFQKWNSAWWGGAIGNWGWRISTGKGPVIDGCTFERNDAYFWGGAIVNRDSPMELVRSTFASNTAWWGGAAFNLQAHVLSTSGPVIDACTFKDNKARDPDSPTTGGAGAALVSVSRVFFPAARLQMTNSLFHDNETAEEQGYAVLTANVTAGSRPLLANNTIANNPAGGIYWAVNPPRVYNSILWDNGPNGVYAEIVPDCPSGAHVEFSDIMGGGGCDIWPGNIESDPEFHPMHPFQLTENSLCVGVADPSYAPEKDILGMYRDDEPDMGAYEYFPEDE